MKLNKSSSPGEASVVDKLMQRNTVLNDFKIQNWDLVVTQIFIKFNVNLIGKFIL